MAKIHTLTYNGTKSSDLGVFVSGSGSFDAAEFDVDKYEIPGRNGDLILSNNRYKNIEITYPAFIPKAFMDKAQNVRNWLRSSKVYARLEDTYDMDHYRLGIPTGVQSFSPENRNDGANFEMTFDCKPQRFLKVGETPETVEPDVQTETGEIVTFETVAESPITSASVAISPIQPLNGYDSPWPAGGGVNKLPPFASFTEKGVTATVASDGTITLNGTATSAINKQVIVNATAGDYCFSLNNDVTVGTSASTTVYFYAVDAGGQWVMNPLCSTRNVVGRGTSANGITVVRMVINSGVTLNNFVIKPQLESGSTATAYAPYSNICPISGHTGAELIRTGKNLWEKESSYSLASSGTIISNATLDIPLKAGSYTLSMGGNISSAASFSFRRSDSTIIGAIQISSAQYDSGKGKYIRSFQLADDAYRINLYVSGAVDINEIQLESGDSATAYETNKGGNAYSASFASAGTVYSGTVYGGSYDFISGALKENIYHDRLLSTVAWYMQTVGGHNYFCTTAFKTALTTYHNLVACTHFGVGGNASALDDPGDCTITNAYGRYYPLNIRCDAIASVEDFKTFLANNEVYVSIESAPREYTLSAQQLTTLQGQNVVWSDAGEITLTYAEPYNIDNPTLFDARPLFTVTNPEEGDVITVNSQAITFVDGYTGTVYIDCETMNAFSGAANLNSIIQATDFPVLVPGTNIVTWTGAGECTMTPRWWEL